MESLEALDTRVATTLILIAQDQIMRARSLKLALLITTL